MKTHPIVVLLAVAWLALEAAVTLARTLLVPALALLLTLATWRPSRPVCPATQPLVHPMAALAQQLTPDLSRRQLQQLAGTRTNHTKHTLAAMVLAA